MEYLMKIQAFFYKHLLCYLLLMEQFLFVELPPFRENMHLLCYLLLMEQFLFVELPPFGRKYLKNFNISIANSLFKHLLCYLLFMEQFLFRELPPFLKNLSIFIANSFFKHLSFCWKIIGFLLENYWDPFHILGYNRKNYIFQQEFAYNFTPQTSLRLSLDTSNNSKLHWSFSNNRLCTQVLMLGYGTYGGAGGAATLLTEIICCWLVYCGKKNEKR
ncbi:hypothetical protein FF38_02856 [Lucilia cuprina]|uniref:Uncharacterized protein n=1 Tax=Lucilia cuprina TaxID=7375 RepID=A0A0L0CGL8_LUCCU|nr:hypothetical protein FF38_02856 [Lucilia cuprina]